MFTFGLVGSVHGFDPIVLLLFALLLEAYIGEAQEFFTRVPHPVALIGRLVGALELKLNREKRSTMDRAVRGTMVVFIVAGTAGSVGWIGAWLSQNHDFGWIFEVLLLVTLIAQRGLFDRVREVAVALEDSGLEAGRLQVAHIVGRDPKQLDEHGVARAAIESLAENFSDAVLAPVFWYVLFGLPGICIYKAVNTMDSMIGHKTPRYRAFGFTAARLDDILNLLPARLSGLLFVIAAIFTPRARPWQAFKIMVRDSRKHRSMNAGWPEGAMAGALNLALAGPRRYAETIVKDAWIGNGTAQVSPDDIKRALYLYAVTCLLSALLVTLMAIVRY